MAGAFFSRPAQSPLATKRMPRPVCLLRNATVEGVKKLDSGHEAIKAENGCNGLGGDKTSICRNTLPGCICDGIVSVKVAPLEILSEPSMSSVLITTVGALCIIVPFQIVTVP